MCLCLSLYKKIISHRNKLRFNERKMSKSVYVRENIVEMVVKYFMQRVLNALPTLSLFLFLFSSPYPLLVHVFLISQCLTTLRREHFAVPGKRSAFSVNEDRVEISNHYRELRRSGTLRITAVCIRSLLQARLFAKVSSAALYRST